MPTVEDVIESALFHRDYDPVKAREYYLRTRELKGRRSSSALKTDSKKERWGYVKNQVTEEKKAAEEDNRTQRTETIEALREKASGERTKIREKLKLVLSRLTEDRKDDLVDVTEERKADLERIQAKVDAKIAALPPIPRGVSKARRAKLSEERREKIAKIRGDAKVERSEISDAAKDERKSISEDTKAKKSTEQESTKATREKLGADLKTSIESARANYEKAKEDLKAKYEAEYQTEYDKIKNS